MICFFISMLLAFDIALCASNRFIAKKQTEVIVCTKNFLYLRVKKLRKRKLYTNDNVLSTDE